MDERLPVLQSLRQLLDREEGALQGLLRMADEMRDALIAADYAALTAVSERTSAAGDELDRFEQERGELVALLGADGATLQQVERLADTLGIAGFERSRERLAASASALQNAQERNAQLILGAARLRERWLSLLAGRSSPTYGAAGRRQAGSQRGFLSRSA